MAGRRIGQAAAALATLTLVGTGAAASAAPPERSGGVVFQERLVDSIEFEFTCGDVLIESTETATLTMTERLRDGVILVSVVEHGEQLFINTETGRVATFTFDAAGKDLSGVDNGDGTITLVGTYNGRESFIDADGRRVFHNAGTTRRSTVIDLGDPADPEDDEVVTSDILQSAGLRGSTGLNLCDVVLASTS